MKQWTAAPAIVAEALVGVSDPLRTVLDPGRPSSPAQVARSLAQSLAPPEVQADPPPWLLTEQVLSYRRILRALGRYNGALLADPVGSGKTYVALAVAGAMNRGPTACLVPAVLVPQWRATAAGLGIPVVLGSHEQVSRGKLPANTRGLVLIDESHHYRNPHTRRYRGIASWLVGRPTLLITATPIVNRTEDLGHQLLLGIRDTALVADGIISIRAMLAASSPAPALGQLVIESELVTARRPHRVCTRTTPSRLESLQVTRLVDAVGQLRLSQSPAIAGLIRGVLLRAVASSPAALAGALRRYRRLLLHARDARDAGQLLDRAALQRFARDSGDQLIWWELVPTSAEGSEIELDDLESLVTLISAADEAARSSDGKLERLRALLADGNPSLVFTTSRETVRYLRDRLGSTRMAWCTGENAGIGSSRLSRGAVLGWFRSSTSSKSAPRHLIVTDVAAEGLDLRRAGRVVHYDLPWTPMRLEQREGRSVRHGSEYRSIEVVHFEPPPLLEPLLRAEATLARKARLPGRIGLGAAGRHVWRWRADLARRLGDGSVSAGSAAVSSPHHGLLLGFALYRVGESEPISSSVLWFDAAGSWTESPEVIEDRLASAVESQTLCPLEPKELQKWLGVAVRPVRDRLALTRSRRWMTTRPTTAAGQLMQRLQLQVREAARCHQPSRLAALGRVLEFMADGHTAGEDALIERLVDRPEREILAAVERLRRPGIDWDRIEARLTGLLSFGPLKPLRSG